MHTRWLVGLVSAGGLALCACGSGGAGHADAGSSSTITWSTATTVEPQITTAVRAICEGAYSEMAAGVPGPLPTSTLIDVPPYQQIYQAEQVWNFNPGAPFNLNAIQGACQKFGFWQEGPSSTAATP